MHLRFHFVFILILSFGFTGVGAAADRPNILFILADDLGYGDVACYNPEAKAPTPHLDALARQGMRFTDAHSPSTVCTPTRYSLLTGRMAFRTGKGGVFTGVGGPCMIEAERLTVASMLKQQGYATAMFGKWHIGMTFYDKDGKPIKDQGIEGVKRIDYSRPATGAPIHRGFDQFYGTVSCPTTDWLYAFVEGDRIPVPPTGLLDKTNLPKHPYANDNRRGMIAPNFDLEEVDLVFLRKSQAFLRNHTRENPGKPFFLLHSMQAVHLPSFPADPFKGKTQAGPHGDFIFEMDWIVGELMNTLDELGIADNTVVMFGSDNGPEVPTVIAMRRDHQHDGARPWRGVKRDQWEGGHRTPFIVRWPGKVKAGTLCDEPLSLTDVFATCAAIVGAELPNDAAEDSFNMLPVLLGQQGSQRVRPYLLQQTWTLKMSLRKDDWKLLDHQGSGGNNYERDGEWGLKPYAIADTDPNAPGQLYNLASDPGETINLYSKHPEIVAELKGLLEEAKASGRTAPKRNPPERSIRTKPNIILIMADDLGYAGLGCYGQTLIRTPRIDQMAREGMRFTDFYAANTVCVPSRCSLITGQHPGHAAIRDNYPPHVDIALENGGGYMRDFPEWAWPPNVPTLGGVLKDAGYRTAQFGKLEAGIPMPAGKMTEHGWDTWMGFRGTGAAFQYYPLELWKNDEKITFESNRPDDVRRPGIVGDKGVYSADLFMEEISKFIRENRQTPFFLYFPSQVPHGRSPQDGDEIQVPDIGAYGDRPWTHLEKLYAAMMTRFDAHVGQIIDLLKELNLDENTVIFLTSDNGDENSYYKYTDRFHAAGPLRAKKRYLYEGGIRVPMIVRWPGQIKAGQTHDLPWAAWDLVATLADLAGVQAPAHTDGISVVPTLLGRSNDQTPREYLYWECQYAKQQAVRMGPWKGFRFGGTKEPIELYDMRKDIGEENNIASAHPDVVKRMRDIMKEAREGSTYTQYWPLPEYRRDDITLDNRVYKRLDKREGY